MIGSFNEVFNKKNIDKVELSQEVINVLNSELPRSFEYIRDNNGDYIVAVKKDYDNNIKLIFDISEDSIGVLKNIPREKWADYLYRTQQAVEITNIRIGDEEKQIPAENMTGNPFNPPMLTKAWLKPAPFPPPHEVTFSTIQGYQKIISIQQQPYDDLDKVKFANVSFPPFSFQMIVGADEDASKLSFRVTPSLANSVEDAIGAIELFLSVLDGTIKVNGLPMRKTVDNNDYDDEPIRIKYEFWKKVRKLEKILNTKFTPSASLPDDDIRFFAELDECLIKDKYIIWKHPFEHFHISGKDIKDMVDNSIEKKSLNLEFWEGPIKASFLGAEFELYSETEVSDFIVANIDWDDEKKESGEIYIADAPGKVWSLKRKYITVDEYNNNNGKV